MSAPDRHLRIVHVTTSLKLAGAQVMLYRLVQTLPADEYAHEVISLTDEGALAEPMRNLGIRTHALGLTRRAPDPLAVARLARLIRSAEPHVVHTWMYHADLIGGLAARWSTRAPVVWGLHNSTLGAGTHRTTRWIVSICARMSHRLPRRIVSVSRVARDVHVAAGYDAAKFVVIPNGIDVQRFRSDAGARHAVRQELGIRDGAVVIGVVARVDPQKDHLTFLDAAAALAARRREVHYLLCGEGASEHDRQLRDAVAARGLLDRCSLLGRRDDVDRVMNAIDIATLSSAYGEAFPLVVGEAMACGVPCVVTDVGDSAFLVGDTGRVVPPRNPELLARSLEELVSIGFERRGALGTAARQRIETNFSLSTVAERYGSLYRQVAAAGGR